MSLCGGITAGIANSCTVKLIGGVEDTLILINKSDIAGYTRNATDPQIIEAISKATGKMGYLFEGKKSSIDAQVDLVTARFSEGFAHQIIFRAFGNSAAIKKQIALLAQSNVVAIVENRFKGTAGDGAFEIFGLEQGLVLTAATSNKSDAETQGAWVLTLRTQDGSIEGYPPASMYVTSYAASKAVFEGLLE